WHAHQLPPWFQNISCPLMYAIELGAPWLSLGPRRLRHFAFWPMAALQFLIALTGNYAFFNMLSVALCAPLLDDTWPFWPRQLRRKINATALLSRRADWPRSLIAPYFAFTLIATVPAIAPFLGINFRWPDWLHRLRYRISPFRSL